MSRTGDQLTTGYEPKGLALSATSRSRVTFIGDGQVSWLEWLPEFLQDITMGLGPWGRLAVEVDPNKFTAIWDANWVYALKLEAWHEHTIKKIQESFSAPIKQEDGAKEESSSLKASRDDKTEPEAKRKATAAA